MSLSSQSESQFLVTRDERPPKYVYVILMITATLSDKSNHMSQYNKDIEHLNSIAKPNRSFSRFVRDQTAEGDAGEPVERGVHGCQI